MTKPIGIKPTGKLPPVQTVDLGGVAIRRHVLDVEAERQATMVRRIGRRLRYVERRLPKGTVPDADFREMYELNGRVLAGLLREQRERAKLTPATGGLAPLDEADVKLRVNELLMAATANMSDADWQEVVAFRQASPEEQRDKLRDARERLRVKIEQERKALEHQRLASKPGANGARNGS